MKMPAVPVKPSTVVLAGGLDTITSPMLAAPGSADFVQNYECVFGGGYQRVGGIERFDGRPRPSDATYITLSPVTTFTVSLGDTVTGATSGATGVVIYDGTFIALTKVTGTFQNGETITVSAVSVGVTASDEPAITADLSNTLNALAAAEYRSDITAVPGDGPVRGFSVLKGVAYAWRDDDAAMKMYKATTSGWTLVDLGMYVSFSNANTVAGEEGTVLTQGGVTATIVRMVLESGTYASGTNTGKIIISDLAGGNFAAGAATTDPTTTGTLTLGAAETTISLTAGGRVQTDIYNFTAALDTVSMYGCDGVNAEFEFDGTVYVPLTIATTERALVVRCHKQHVLFGFRGAIISSGIAQPYQFTVLSGGAEIGTGDVITGMIPVAGSETNAALLILCEQSAWVMFGNDSTEWQMTPLTRDAGGSAYSAQDCGVPMVHDTPGFRAYKPTDTFGDFEWNLESRRIETLVQNKVPVASCFSKAFSRYRVFFSDGTVVSATPGQKGWEWSRLDYDRSIVIAWSGEVSGVTRTFYGDDDGFVYEADVGRSFDGDTITAILKLHGLNQGASMLEKTYRWAVVETIGESPFYLAGSASFDDDTPDKNESETFEAALSGGGAAWDVFQWDRMFWDSPRLRSLRFNMNGNGYNIAPLFISQADDELPHQIRTFTVIYTPRRIRRD